VVGSGDFIELVAYRFSRAKLFTMVDTEDESHDGWELERGGQLVGGRGGVGGGYAGLTGGHFGDYEGHRLCDYKLEL
jgi:hypothetical protein